jgi:MFS transporter, DHA1 family, tetracycline resistance protein
MIRAFLPLLITVFIDSLGFGLILPLLPNLFLHDGSPILPDASLSIKGFVYGIILSTFCVGQFLGGPFFGALSDRHGRKKILCFTLVIGGIGYLFLAASVLIGSVVLFLLARFITGACAGNFSVAQSMMVDLSTEEQKCTNFGLIGMAWGVGFILGPCLGGKLADLGGVTWPFLFTASLCWINLCLAGRFLKETLQIRRQTSWKLLEGVRNVKRAFGHPVLKGIFIVIFLFNLGWGFFTEFAAIFLIDRFSFEAGDIGNFYAYAGIWLVICQGFLIRFLVRRFSSIQLLRYALFFLGLDMFAFMASRSSWILFIAVPFIALPQALIYPNSASIVSSLSRKDEQGEMLGILSSIQGFSIGLLPLFSGAVVANYPAMPIIFSSFLIFIAFSAFLFFFRKDKTIEKMGS